NLNTSNAAASKRAREGTCELGFWCIKGTQNEETHQFDLRIDHSVSAWSQIVRSEVQSPRAASRALDAAAAPGDYPHLHGFGRRELRDLGRSGYRDTTARASGIDPRCCRYRRVQASPPARRRPHMSTYDPELIV